MMGRIRKAWRALRGHVEVREVVKEVTILGTPEPVTLYEVVEAWQGLGYAHDIPIAHYLTCEQAHAENPGRRVRVAEFYRIGDTYLSGLQVAQIIVQPKPKVPKGKRNGR